MGRKSKMSLMLVTEPHYKKVRKSLRKGGNQGSGGSDATRKEQLIGDPGEQINAVSSLPAQSRYVME